ELILSCLLLIDYAMIQFVANSRKDVKRILFHFSSQSCHRNSTKIPENRAFLTFLCVMRWDEPLFLAVQFKTAHKINGFEPVSYGMAVRFFKITAQLRRS